MPAPNIVVTQDFVGDPARVVEVVIPYYQGTVAEAVAAARAEVQALTVDDVPGFRQAIDQGDSATLEQARLSAITAALIFG